MDAHEVDVLLQGLNSTQRSVQARMPYAQAPIKLRFGGTREFLDDHKFLIIGIVSTVVVAVTATAVAISLYKKK
jgi:hypothetical protein